MIDTTLNNYLLPLRGEDIDRVDFVLSLGIKARAKMERTPIFNELNKEFWIEHFRERTHKVLIRQAVQLGLVNNKRSISKIQLVHMLAGHYQKAVQ